MSIKKLTPVAAMVLLAGCATSGQPIGDRIHNSISDDTYRDPITKITYDRKTGNAANLVKDWKESCKASNELRDPTRIAYKEFVAAKNLYEEYGDTDGYFTARYNYTQKLGELTKNTQACVEGIADEAGEAFGCGFRGGTVYVRGESDKNNLPRGATSIADCKIIGGNVVVIKGQNNFLDRSAEIQKGCYNAPRPDGIKCSF